MLISGEASFRVGEVRVLTAVHPLPQERGELNPQNSDAADRVPEEDKRTSGRMEGGPQGQGASPGPPERDGKAKGGLVSSLSKGRMLSRCCLGRGVKEQSPAKTPPNQQQEGEPDL